MKSAILAVSLLIGITACNRDSKRDSGREENTSEQSKSPDASAKAAEETRQTGRDIKEGTGKAVDKAKEVERDVKEGVEKASKKAAEESRQTSRDVKNAISGDKAKTDSDKQLLTRIRTALKKDKATVKEAEDVKITVDNGMVRLSGTVTSDETKKEMTRVARDLAGTAKVSDDMKVAERVGTGSSD